MLNFVAKYKIILLFVLIGLGLYANTLNNQMFWDDFDFILNNQYVQDFEFGKFFSGNVIEGAGLGSNYWRPVLLTVFAVEWRLWGDHVFAWHLTNTLLHIANAVLLVYILQRLFKQSWLAFLTGLVFLIHPLQTEAVTYVNSLGDSLSVFFILLGLWLYSKNQDSILKISLFYALALMSKETAIIMPGLLILIDLVRFPKEWFKIAVKNLWPLFLLAGIYILLRATALNFGGTFNLYAESNLFTENVGIRILTFFRILLTYFGLLFYPNNLHMERFMAIQTDLNWTNAAGGLLFFAMLIFAFTKFKRYPIVSFGLLWFLLALAPTSNILIPINGLIYEHWLYVPMVGFWLAIFGTVNYATINKSARYAFYLLFTAYCLLLSIQTISRNDDWQDPITFYNQTLRYAPDSYRVINNLGMAYADAGHSAQAIETYQRAIVVDPAVAVAYHNLANSFRDLNRTDEAVVNYEKAISAQPGFIYSYNGLAQLYLDQKNYTAAIAVLEKLKAANPGQEVYATGLIDQIKSLK